MSSPTTGIAQLLLSGMARLQDDQVARANDPGLHRSLDSWFAECWPSRQIHGTSNYTVPRGGASNEMLQFEVTWSDGAERQTDSVILRFESEDEPVALPASEVVSTSTQLEFLVQENLSHTDACPTVPLVGLETDAGVIGRAFYVMHYVSGRVPPTAGQNVASFLVEALDPQDRAALMTNALHAMAAFHGVDWRTAGLDWLYADHETALPRQLGLYRDAVERYLRGTAHPVLSAALDWLDTHAPAPAPLSLTWGDARPGNMMFGATTNDVVAVLDWELAALLPPSMDIGHWMLTDYMVHETEGTERLPGFPTREEQLATYEQASGRPATDVGYWEVFAAAKSAYVFLRVVRRMQDKGAMPAEGDALFMDNFAVRYLSDRVIDGVPGLLER